MLDQVSTNHMNDEIQVPNLHNLHQDLTFPIYIRHILLQILLEKALTLAYDMLHL
jgi:hypothetical protein